MARYWGPAPNTERSENRRARRRGFGLSVESDRDRYPNRCRRFGHSLQRRGEELYCVFCPKRWPAPPAEGDDGGGADQQTPAEDEHDEHGERREYGDRKSHGER